MAAERDGGSGGGGGGGGAPPPRRGAEEPKPSRLVEAARAKAAAAAAAAGGALPPLHAQKAAPTADFEAQKAADIARNVDYLRVLAGEKTKLSLTAEGDKGYVPFAGRGEKMGGGGDSAPGKEAYRAAGPKKVIDAKGNVTVAPNAFNSAEERERRAAAIEARMAKMAAAAAEAAAAAGGGAGV